MGKKLVIGPNLWDQKMTTYFNFLCRIRQKNLEYINLLVTQQFKLRFYGLGHYVVLW